MLASGGFATPHRYATHLPRLYLSYGWDLAEVHVLVP